MVCRTRHASFEHQPFSLPWLGAATNTYRQFIAVDQALSLQSLNIGDAASGSACA